MDGVTGLDSSVFMISTLWKLFLAFMSVPVLFLILRIADNVIGINFKSKMREMDNVAFANYVGLRFVGVCIIVGFALL